MNIGQDVILDLLPLYVSGEASDETRQIIETYLREHPGVASLASEMAEAARLMDEPAAVPDLSNAQVRTLQRVRRAVQYRNGALGVALAYTLAPFSFVVSGGSFRWLILDQYPQAAMTFLVLAVIFWGIYVYLRIQTRRSGI